MPDDSGSRPLQTTSFLTTVVGMVTTVVGMATTVVGMATTAVLWQQVSLP